MKRYPSYKESGIAWIGQVPEHWGVDKINETGELRSLPVSTHYIKIVKICDILKKGSSRKCSA